MFLLNYPRRWLPILSDGGASGSGLAVAGSLAGRVNEALDDLAKVLAQPVPGIFEQLSPLPADLAEGPAGAALFFYYLDQARPGQGYDGQALAYLETAIELTAEARSAPGLYTVRRS